MPYRTSCTRILGYSKYAKDFGAIVKESLKRTFWPGKYLTHDRSYYTVPEPTVLLSAVSFVAPLPAEQVIQKDRWSGWRTTGQCDRELCAAKLRRTRLVPFLRQYIRWHPKQPYQVSSWISMGTRGMKLKCTMLRIQLRTLPPTVLLT